MGEIRKPQPVALFASLMFADEATAAAAEASLIGRLGPVRERTERVAFTHSRYYEPEMGVPLMRYFLLFERLIDREALAGVKHETNAVEQATARDGKRRVNIDPGYLALEHVVLATTKGYAHRIYLGQGIYADLTLMFGNGRYRPLEWTYPDYAGGEVATVFDHWREIYKKELRCHTV